MAHYDLDRIREAAKQERIQYRGGGRSNVRKTIANLGYTVIDVVNSISSLSPSDFHNTYEYPDQTFDDSYITKVIREDEEIEDEIFMKLRLLDNGGIEIVEIGAFHLPKR